MTVIGKYLLSVPESPKLVTYIEAPYDFVPLSAHTQFGAIAVWGTFSIEASKEPHVRHTFLVVPTGIQADLRRTRFLGTVLLNDGSLVFHVFSQRKGRV